MRMISLAAMALMAMTVSALADDFGGDYTVQGTNLDGSAYSGDATITITSETTCVIKWVTGSTTRTASACAMAMPSPPATR